MFGLLLLAGIMSAVQAGRVDWPGNSKPAKRFLVAAAHPKATRAGYRMLQKGGSAADAAIAVQLVLTVVEPQSSGIGGGAFALYFDRKTGKTQAWDGRETAPAAATPELFLKDGEPMDWWEALAGGRAVGVPGVVDLLYKLHQQNGRLPWHELFEPAIELARNGFVISEHLHQEIAQRRNPALGRYDAAWAYFFPAGEPAATGSVLRNAELADTLERIARLGPDAFYRGDIAEDMVKVVRSAKNNPGLMSHSDLQSYEAKERTVVCAPYRSYRVCGMPPPTSGGVTVLQILGILESFDLPSMKPMSAQAMHLFTQAERLAYADRARYLADPDFVEVPVNELLDRKYLATRAGLIDSEQDMGEAPAGDVSLGEERKSGESPEQPGTSHLSIVDAEGNAISMTSSIEMSFGSTLMVRGFLLNNQLTDFSFLPGKEGTLVANRVQGGKRPRSSMSPMLVFDSDGNLLHVVGSPGGSRIIGYVAQALVALLDWKLPVQQALDLPHVVNCNGVTELEENMPLGALSEELALRGHQIRRARHYSGLQAISIRPDGLYGGADKRREGEVAGQ